MAKRSNQKLRLLYINKILHELTDEYHGIPLTQLASELARYGIFAERKTLYDDVECLRVFGVDIRVRRERNVIYYVASRTFSVAELKLMCDLIEGTRLSSAHRAAIDKRLSELGGKRSAHLLARGAEHTEACEQGTDTLENAQTLCRAILGDMKVSCKRFSWNEKKQRILSSGGERFVYSPWIADFSDGFRFLVYDEASAELSVIDAERLLEVKLIDDKRAGEYELTLAKESGLVDRLLYGVESCTVRLKAPIELADEMIKRFGSGITVSAQIDGYFEFSAKVQPNAEFFAWVALFLGRVSIVSPSVVREEYLDMLRRAYETEFVSI